MDLLIENLRAARRVTVLTGAGGLLHEAARHGAFTAEINVEATEASTRVDLAIRAPAEQLLRDVDARLAGS
jgi:NAD-dependent SIR2 family protein deacetylase